jgi:histidyl-tRNA synthetase
VSAPGLGAQDAIAGGGRYDHLYSELGGGEVPCTGFSIGIERLLMAIENADPQFKEKIFKKRVYVAPLFNQADIQKDIKRGCEIYDLVVRIISYLRSHGIEAVMGESSDDSQTHFKKADKLGYPFVVYASPDEIQKNQWRYKSKGNPEQQVSKEDLVNRLKEGMNL